MTLLLCLATGASSTQKNWVEVQSPNFLVQGPVTQETGLELARNLELLHQLLAQRVNHASPAQTVVLAFNGQRDFRRYSPWPDAEGVSAYFSRGAERTYIGVDVSARRAALPSVFHEYIHAFASAHFPNMPLWFQEGLAELYSNLRIERDHFVRGLPQREHLRVLRDQRWISWAELLSADPHGALYSSNRTRLFYAQSWLLVHFLVSSTDAADRLPILLQSVSSGDGDRFESLLEVLGTDEAGFSQALRRYSRKARFDGRWIARSRGPSAVAQVRVLTEAETLARLGDLLSERPKPAISLARLHFERALRLDPGQRLAVEGLARLEQSRD